MHYYAIKDFLDGDIENSIVFNLEEISFHKEGPNAIIIISPDESRGYIGFRSVAPPPP